MAHGLRATEIGAKLYPDMKRDSAAKKVLRRWTELCKDLRPALGDSTR